MQQFKFDIGNLASDVVILREGGPLASAVSEAIALQGHIENNKYNLFGLGYCGEKIHLYFNSVSRFEVDESWRINSDSKNGRQYAERLMKAFFAHCVITGAENEKQFDENESIGNFMRIAEMPTDKDINQLWSKLYKLFFDTLRKLMNYAEDIPDPIYELITKSIARFNENNVFRLYNQFSLEDILFIYGVLFEMEKHVEAQHTEIKLKRQ